MKEDFVVFVWKYKLWNSNNLQTTAGEDLHIINSGIQNQDSGPDFSSAIIKIGDTTWAGNVEMHVKSSDFFKHNHEQDRAYDTIILHVVWNHDADIRNKQGAKVPVLELSNKTDKNLIHNYARIVSSKKWIPCQEMISEVDQFVVESWLNRLTIERLERKSEEILKFYNYFNRDWEQTFFYFLCRNFGFKINSEPFGFIANNTHHTIFQKHKTDISQLEAILFGQAGLLDKNFKEAYPVFLKKEYDFLQKKYSFHSIDPSLWKYARLRPFNFPDIRLSQLAALLYRSSGILSIFMETQSLKTLKSFLAVKSSPYWENHYRLDTPSVKKTKNLGSSAIYNLLINTIIPFKFVYGRENLKSDISDAALFLLSEIPAESNSIIKKWIEIGLKPKNASESQALLELKKYYCTPKKCLSCSIGFQIIRKSSDEQK